MIKEHISLLHWSFWPSTFIVEVFVAHSEWSDIFFLLEKTFLKKLKRFYPIYQLLRSGRIWDMVQFLSGV